MDTVVSRKLSKPRGEVAMEFNVLVSDDVWHTVDIGTWSQIELFEMRMQIQRVVWEAGRG